MINSMIKFYNKMVHILETHKLCIMNLIMVAWLFTHTLHSLITLYLAVLDILVTSGRVTRSRAVECSSGEPGYGGQHSSHRLRKML